MDRSRLIAIAAIAAIIGASAVIIAFIAGEMLDSRRAATAAGATSRPIQPVMPRQGTEAPPDSRLQEQAVTTQPVVVSEFTSAVGTTASVGREASGLVVDLAGFPVSGATVAFIYPSGSDPGRTEAQTGPDGRFVARNLRGQSVPVVTASAAGYESSSAENVPLPAEELTFSLQPLAGMQGVISQLTADRGEIPYNGTAQVVLMRRVTAEGSTLPGSVRQAAISEGQYVEFLAEITDVTSGLVVLAGLPQGVYRLSVLANGLYSESEPFTADPSGTASAAVMLGVSAPVSGSIVSRSTSAPISGAKCLIYHTSKPRQFREPAVLSISAGPDGVFDFGQMPPGDYTLSAGADGYSTKTIEAVRVTPAGVGPAPLELVLAEGTAGLIVATTDEAGRPLPNCPLVLAMVGSADPRTYFARSDAGGIARFDTVVAGRYTLAATLAGGSGRQKSIEVMIEEGLTKQVQVVFLPTYSVTGIVMTENGTAPYEGLLAFVARGTMGAEQYAKADSTGTFRIELEPGEYTVSRPGLPGSQSVDVREGVGRLLEMQFP